ncbi:hypothetical protein C8R43DRAFT_1237172 [Mycena crocata]|nr:hypothetical protein C8R43DRAFT_1237172 [Mycena crocata]
MLRIAPLSCFLLACILHASVVVAAPVASSRQAKCDCTGAVGDDSRYYCGDWRLGPTTLPDTHPLSTILANYDRLGGLCPVEFLQNNINMSSGFFIYPPQDGFQLSTTDMPIYGNQTLLPGMRLDRFGGETGRYLAPAYTPFGQRALPPASLNDGMGEDDPQANYHLYKVEMSFDVVAGPIAPWFGQPGQGTQYLAMRDVETLVADGYLVRIGADDNPGPLPLN